MLASAVLDQGSLLFVSPYEPALIQALKAQIPASDRQWDAAVKAWRVLPKHGQVLQSLTERYLGYTLSIPSATTTTVAQKLQLLDVRYIGACKDRGGGDCSAFGWMGGSWSVIFPEAVLRAWFADDARPDELPTLYAALGVVAAAKPEDLKSAYRRLARQWHPDVCREADAAEQFKRINHAYEILSDSRLRAKYDAGLALQATITREQGQTTTTTGYKPPLRCGYILASGTDQLGRFVAQRIDAWEDIVNETGQTLVTSWPMGADTFVENWV